MSRLFRSTSIVCVPAVWGEDNKGNKMWLPGTEQYTVLADVQPSTVSAEVLEGQRVDEYMNVYARSLPFTETRLMEVQWNGDTWDVFGAVKFFKVGHKSQHVEFQIRKRGARVGTS